MKNVKSLAIDGRKTQYVFDGDALCFSLTDILGKIAIKAEYAE